MNPNHSHTASDAFDHPIDHRIDRALSSLRDAQPRSGLNSRILTSLEHHSVTRRSRFHISAHIALWAATSAAIFAVAALVILQHHAAPTQLVRSVTKPVILSGARTGSPASLLAGAGSAKSKNPEVARRTTNSKPFSATNLAYATGLAINIPSSRPKRGARSGETPVLAHAERNDGITTTPTDAQLLADLHAPSHPAPPLPLTAQEKLLLRGLRYGNLTQIAELNPLVRARQEADETAAFKAFFPDPPPLKQPLGDTE